MAKKEVRETQKKKTAEQPVVNSANVSAEELKKSSGGGLGNVRFTPTHDLTEDIIHRV